MSSQCLKRRDQISHFIVFISPRIHKSLSGSSRREWVMYGRGPNLSIKHRFSTPLCSNIVANGIAISTRILAMSCFSALLVNQHTETLDVVTLHKLCYMRRRGIWSKSRTQNSKCCVTIPFFSATNRLSRTLFSQLNAHYKEKSA